MPIDYAAVDKLADSLYDLRNAALDNPIERGTCFTLTLGTMPQAASADSRPRRQVSPKLLARLGSETSWYLVRPLQRSGTESQVWLASLQPNSEDSEREEVNTHDCVVLKIVQLSMLCFPTLDWADYDIAAYRRPRETLPQAGVAYERLADQQGSTLPYFFGRHKASVSDSVPNVSKCLTVYT